MWIPRFYESQKDFLQSGKVNLVYGPRRSGKTTLIVKMLDNLSGKIYKGSGDDILLRSVLSSENTSRILSAMRNYDVIFIDEAQRIKNIGWGLKILVDNLPESLIIATGSSSFSLSVQVGEPLTGRSNSNLLFPISIGELLAVKGGMKVIQELESYLIYGMYPEVLSGNSDFEKSNYLNELRNSYLMKDILEMENLKNSDMLFDLLRLLSFQIGNEVSLNELANNIGIAKQTVARYLDLLEKSFIIKKISGFSKNLRKEVTKTHRYYFFDNGIRNSIINNFNSLDQRVDVGMLWENFIVMERLKKQHYKKIFSNNYFWRTYDQKEVDFVEEREGMLFGYEFKWNPKKNKIQKEWLKTYPNASFETIHKDNFLPWLE